LHKLQIPKDILQKIEELPATLNKEYILNKITLLWQMPLNVGPSQLARCILFLVENEKETIDEIFETNFFNDPRNLIMYADKESGGKLNWGIDEND